MKYVIGEGERVLVFKNERLVEYLKSGTYKISRLSNKKYEKYVCEGLFETERNLSMMRTPEEKASHVQRVPLKRWGKPEELAGAAVFFASEAASYINGQILTIDGGFSASF